MNGSPGRALIGAAAFFTLAFFVFGSALVRAMGSGPSLVLPPASSPQVQTNADAAAPSLTMDALMLAVENDPFTPERTRPAERYRLPGDVDPEPEPPPPEAPPVPEFLLSGTVVTSDGGLALVQVGEDPPTMLALGDGLQGYRLVSVTASGAVMANEERQLQLRVPSPPRVAHAAGETERGNARNDRNARGRPSVDPRQMRQIIDRARAAGASPQMIESMMRMIQERGLTSIDNMEIGPNGFSFRSGNTAVRSRTAPPPPPSRDVPDTMELRTPRAPQLR